MRVLLVVLVFGLVATGVYVVRKKGSELINWHRAIGGEKDVNGCFISAGYSWCESKAKCLRPWEEICLSEATEDDVLDIKQAFMDKHERESGDIRVTLDMFTGNYARGGVNFIVEDDFGPGGIFLAYKEGDNWEIAFDGNGMYDCQELEVYNFPAEMLTGCSVREDLEEAGSVELSNPASTYCTEQGGMVEMRNNDEGQYGVCIFENGNECEEWAFFRGECENN